MRKLMIAVALLAAPAAAQAQTVWVLTKSWIQNGKMMCQYSNGTVLSLSAGPCPPTIGG